MKQILLILSILILNGCSTEEQATKSNAKSEFQSMCDRYELAICGDDVEVLTYDSSTSYGYLWEFEYVSDKTDSYDYLTEPYRGDCEDFAITFLENSIRKGAVEDGTAELILGKVDGKYHTWLIIGDELFDTQYRIGIEVDIAYANNEYKRLSSLYRY